MNPSDEQTPLISSNRDVNRSNNRRSRNQGPYYISPLSNGSTLDLLPQPQRPQPLHQHLDRARRHEQAHAITPRHWLVLLLACLLLFGNYYCYDIPAALNVQLGEWLGDDYATHQYHINLLYSVYSLPNIILPLFGGYLIDRLSASRMLILFSLCVCVGQGLFAIGVSAKSIGAMVLGRFIFGIGGECLEVAQAKITTDWFKSRWLGFALGLNLSSARIGTALNDNISPAIAAHGGGVVGASWAGVLVCATSLFCGIALAYLDRPESRKESGVRLDARDRNKDAIRSRKDNIVGRQAINVSSDSTMTMSSVALQEEEELEKENEMAEDDEMHYSEIFTLQPNFWILSLICISLYVLQKKWYMKNPTKAGAVMSIPDIVSSVGSPLCGYLVDRFGHRARYIPLSAILLIWAHAQLGFTFTTPIIGMFILGYLQLSDDPTVEELYTEGSYEDHIQGDHHYEPNRHQAQHRHDYYDPREPGFEYRRQRRYSQDLLGEDGEDLDDIQDRVTTKPVGEGIITVIPHRRRHSMAGFAGHIERSRLRNYANHARESPAEGLPEINPALSYIGSINETETTTTELDLSTTSTTTTTTVVTKVNCKHGPLECAGNTQQLCFREFFPDYKVWVPFVTTMNSWQPRRIGEPVYAREVAERVLGLRQRRVRRFLSREEGDKEEKEKEQETLLEKVDECSNGQRGFELLIRSVQNTIDNGVGTSCTVFIDNKKRCVVDGGEWRECPGGSTIADFVRSIKEAAGKVFRISW
ncbi:hypothetical protein BGZ91_009727 [Linnemannia elongata]|nr:hypothetical protein BGZ91_009727 [Linnemannia elongata]